MNEINVSIYEITIVISWRESVIPLFTTSANIKPITNIWVSINLHNFPRFLVLFYSFSFCF